MKQHEVQFIQLSDGWNAEPNAPDETVSVDGDAVVLEFAVNALLYPVFVEGSRAQLHMGRSDIGLIHLAMRKNQW